MYRVGRVGLTVMNLAWNDYKNGLRSSNLEDLAGMKTGAETEDFWLGRKDCSYDGDF